MIHKGAQLGRVVPAVGVIKEEAGERRAERQHSVERLVGHLKENRRLAIRYDNAADAFLGIFNLAAIKLWLKFVNDA